MGAKFSGPGFWGAKSLVERRCDAAAPRLVQHRSVKETCNADGLQQAIGHATRSLNAKHLPEQLAWPRPLTIVHYTFFSIHPLKKKMFGQISVILSLLPLKLCKLRF